MDRNNAPSTLHEKLQEEPTRAERALPLRQNPRGDETSRQESRHDDRAPPAEELRQVADDGAADAGACLHEDGGARGTAVLEAFLREH